MVEFEPKERYDFADLCEIMRLLRSEDGCPWDRVQTHESIRQNMLEEAYEVADAIDRKNPEMLCEELGDVLMQVVFHAGMSADEGTFDLGDVTDGVCKKLVERHPHVFGTVVADTAQEVLKNWDAIKEKSKHQETVSDTVEAVPACFPALMRAQKVQKRAAKLGWDFSCGEDPLDDVLRLTDQLRKARESGDGETVNRAAGDLLFAAVSATRRAKGDAELALTQATDRFASQFSRAERQLREEGTDAKELQPQTAEKLWKKVEESHE